MAVHQHYATRRSTVRLALGSSAEARQARPSTARPTGAKGGVKRRGGGGVEGQLWTGGCAERCGRAVCHAVGAGWLSFDREADRLEEMRNETVAAGTSTAEAIKTEVSSYCRTQSATSLEPIN